MGQTPALCAAEGSDGLFSPGLLWLRSPCSKVLSAGGSEELLAFVLSSSGSRVAVVAVVLGARVWCRCRG